MVFWLCCLGVLIFLFFPLFMISALVRPRLPLPGGRCRFTGGKLLLVIALFISCRFAIPPSVRLLSIFFFVAASLLRSFCYFLLFPSVMVSVRYQCFFDDIRGRTYGVGVSSVFAFPPFFFAPSFVYRQLSLVSRVCSHFVSRVVVWRLRMLCHSSLG